MIRVYTKEKGLLMTQLSIGKVAKQAGVGVETVRFYEREGLIDKPLRGVSGYRQYNQEVVDRVLFIRRAKALGFSLKEIHELLGLRIKSNVTSAEVRSRATDKIEEISDKISSLQQMKQALEKLVSACSGKGPVSECPILEAMDGRLKS
jgi:MerR family mercuric resistance operon transcriptional regulator